MARLGEFITLPGVTNSDNNSSYCDQNIVRDDSPFDQEIPPFISRLCRLLRGGDGKKTGREATHVLEKRSYLWYSIQPLCGDLEEEIENGAAM